MKNAYRTEKSSLVLTTASDVVLLPDFSVEELNYWQLSVNK